MIRELKLPQADKTLSAFRISEAARREWPRPRTALRRRDVYAAAHVVCDPLVEHNPATETHLDWETTLAYRRHLWSYGFSVAEAMDTSQRGAGLDWNISRELIGRSVAEARATGGVIACGAGTDQLARSETVTLDDVARAYEEQCEYVEKQGGRVILMASRALALCARSSDDYAYVYERILRQIGQPVILHWLGEMFDEQLAGYWGTIESSRAMDVCLEIINAHRAKIAGIKISLLDYEQEIAMRRRLPDGVKMYTGDDFHYDVLIKGDECGYSHALLGIFDAIAPAASAALQALDAGDVGAYETFIAPTVPLARHIFCAPTRFYKTGIVFLAYLNDYQSHFRMVAGAESARSIVHLAQLFRLAAQAQLLRDPEIATARMRHTLALAGID